MEWLSVASHYPLVIIPFATSIVLVIGSHEAEPAQPRALIGGHVWHRWRRRRPWPQRWLQGASGKPIAVSRLGVPSSIL
jgi:hypothetical protein